MQLKNLLPVALGAVASAQSLAEVFANHTAQLSSLDGLLGNTSLLTALSSASNLTILAPSNDALSAFLASPRGMAAGNDTEAIVALLQYHVLNGTHHAYNFTARPQFIPTMLMNSTYANVTGGQSVEVIRNGTNVTIYSGLVERSRVTMSNLNFTGGTVHVIDKVLTVPESIVSTGVAGNLTSLVGAVTRANAVDAIDSLRDITIFAPSNAAFSRIGSALQNISAADLGNVLNYHVVNGTVGYSSILTNTTLRTLQGGEVTVRIENGSVFVNSARVTTPDLLVENGVIHVIDAVLNPNATTATPDPTASSTMAVFPGATSVSTDVFTESVPPQTTVIVGAPTGAGGAVTSSSSAGAKRAWQTGAVGVGALFGGAGMLLNM
ncbi:putative Periostin [Amylocarpus encephaloides]|uniref:Periostin n=1 Tax=Amylocarpus encephaloides TaxID=45428 RepID=A0A9P7YI34_9HELO|nr:putative Periostin [Amylocarpus encephaloides]